jgi:hypothetical protein
MSAPRPDPWPASQERILSVLADGPYACSEVIRLSGGVANITARGKLLKPLKLSGKTQKDSDKIEDQIASDTVVIKYAEREIPIMDFTLTKHRSVCLDPAFMDSSHNF